MNFCQIGVRRKKRRYIIIPKLLVGTDFDIGSLKKHRTITNLVRVNLEDLPFKSNSFDLATSNMVFEHLKNPGIVLKEVHRILKPHGKLLIHTPNRYGYIIILSTIISEKLKNIIIKILEGRISNDVFPTYYRFNKVEQMLSLAENNNFTVKDIKMISGIPQFAMIFPIAILELFLIKILMFEKFKKYRNNIITIFVKNEVP